MAAVLAAGIGFLLLGGVASSSSSITVTQGDFTLTCPAGTVAEGATLSCTLTNTSAEAKPWPVVAILHLSTDDDRALVRGASIDVTLGAPSPAATIDGGVTWIGDTLVGYSRFDWSGDAGADPTQTTTTVGSPGNSRTVSIVASQDSLDEDSEKFYVALGPDGSKGVGILYNNKASVTLTDDDSASADVSLSSLSLFAGQSLALSSTEASQSKNVAYEVTEATLTAAATHGEATMTLSASFNSTDLDLDGRSGTSIAVLSGQESAAVPLAVGTTTLTLTVTAEDGSTTGTHAVEVVRAGLGTASTVTVSAGGFTLTCPAEVAKATVMECTLRANRTAKWPVVAVIHSSADGDSRALVAEDPIIPDIDPSYSQDLSLSDEQQPARTAFNYGYGELFSGGSRSLYRTYGFEKFDWPGTASSGSSRKVAIDLKDNEAISGAAEIFYVALAPSDYTGLSKLVDNMVPILLKELPAARSVTAPDIKSTSAEVEVKARNPDGTLHLRYRAGTSGTWTETSATATSSPVTFSLSDLTAETEYHVQASFDEDFSTGVRSGTFTTPPAPSLRSLTATDVTQTSVTVTIGVANPEGSNFYLHVRAGTREETLPPLPSWLSSTPIPLTFVEAGTSYYFKASFDRDFSTGVMTASITTPPAPSVLSVSAGSITKTAATVTVAAANPTGTLYLRHRQNGTTTWTEASKTASSSPVTFDVTGLSAGTTYDVEASFNNDFSDKATASFKTTPATSVLSVLSVSAGSITDTSATVTVAAANPTGTLYLRHRQNGTTTWTEASKTASSSPVTFDVTGLSAGTTYDVEASFNSGFSDKVTASFNTTPAPSVSSVSPGSITDTSATVTVAAANPTGTLYLRHRQNGTTTWTEASKTASSSPVTFDVSGLSAETGYQIQASFSSSFSTGVASGTFTTEPPPPPSVVSVVVGSITSSSARVTVEVDDADGSTLYLRRLDPNGNWRHTARVSQSTTTFSLTGLTADANYYVEVSFDSDFLENVHSEDFRTLERSVRTPGPGPTNPGPTGPGPTGPGPLGPTSGEETPEPEPPRFSDVSESSVHAADIEALRAAGITAGCSQQPLRYCPDQPVTRAQMATFLTRALNLEAPATSAGFSDVDESSVHAADIEALRAAGITAGCSQQPLQFCPDQPVTRAQMATFLTRALNLEAPATSAGFSDVDESSVHAADIEALRAAGITAGCSQQPLQFCPDQPVTRAQMATFLTRALNLEASG